MTTTETPLHIRQAEGLERMAAMLREHPELAERFRYLSFSQHCFGEDAEALGLFARVAAAYADNGTVEKRYSDKFAVVEARFGAVSIHLQTDREQVCERVQVGTETVTRKERDPEAVEKALAEIPETEVTEEVPVYEWQCKPLLASSVDGS
ncbi:hypothetical protein [Amycolatopsis taiwanensis]|uniref:hypothetical protein n=1 Tax=Amycolatopsis taiwanensis TaxID=342230 RepID=UPI000481F808|nr:hypothetical protein [Amycolatopsis taiwanensis]